MIEIDGDLDPKIAPLVHALRDVGFNTTSSCQGGKGHACDLAVVVIEPQYSDLTNVKRERDSLARNVLKQGHHGFTVQIFENWFYQKDVIPWKTFKIMLKVELWSDL